MLKELADACDRLEVSMDRMAQWGVESAIVERELGEESGQAREVEDGYEFGLAQDERFGHS